MKKSRYSRARRALIFWTLFIGIGAVFGALCMLYRPEREEILHGCHAPVFSGAAVCGRALYRSYLFGDRAACRERTYKSDGSRAALRKEEVGRDTGGVFPALRLCCGYAFNSICSRRTSCRVSTSFSARRRRRPDTRRGCSAARSIFAFRRRNIRISEKRPTVLWCISPAWDIRKKAALEEAERTGACVFEVRSTERTEGNARLLVVRKIRYARMGYADCGYPVRP